MTVMIRQHETLFPLAKDVPLSPPSNKSESQKNTPRSFVGWESAEVRPDDRTQSLGHAFVLWLLECALMCNLETQHNTHDQ